MYKCMILAILVLFLIIGDPVMQWADACPNCKLGNETDSNLPRGYMYSILFMISMPMTLLTCFAVGFYRLSRLHPVADIDEQTEAL